MTTKASASPYTQQLEADDAFVFGAETSGLPTELLEQFAPERRLRLPMRAGQRSLNLSNAIAVTEFEAWRPGRFCRCWLRKARPIRKRCCANTTQAPKRQPRLQTSVAHLPTLCQNGPNFSIREVKLNRPT